jgi:hypothetical protein
LLTVDAIDDDKGVNGQVFYYLDESNIKSVDWKNFILDSKTGVLTLNTNLDRLKQSLYTV